MAKRISTPEEDPRRTRRQELLEQRSREQRRQVYMVVGGVVGLIILVLLVGIINETVFKPGQPVAEVGGTEISTRDWQRRVRYQRAQFINNVEEFYDSTGGNVGLVQQLLGQQMQLLLQPEQLGGLVLTSMIDEVIIREAAEERGIVVTDADVQEAVEAQFNYFGGGLPTPFPTPTETAMPTPSLTPIPTAVITEVVPTNTPSPTLDPGSTATPAPTATAVSADSFEDRFSETMRDLRRLGGSEAVYRDVVRAQLYRERLADALAEEQNLSEVEEQASFFILTYDDEEAATAALQQIDEQGFVPTWNSVRSAPSAERIAAGANARELLWRNQASVRASLGDAAAEAVFALDLEQRSGLLPQFDATASQATGGDASGESAAPTVSAYHIVFVTGRELRPLTAAALDQAKQEALSLWLEEQRVARSETFDRWTSRVPTQPELDPLYLQSPTPVPTDPALLQPTIVVPTVAPTAAP
jgi:hypothetical protein